MHNTKDIIPFTLDEIFKSGKYSIPIYQRNYAWKEGQIVQLINDVNDFAKAKIKQNYYIGTLVVYKKLKEDSEVYFETIDGQQRLTTLNILYAVLKNIFSLNDVIPNFKKTILEFENRTTSSNALDFAYNGKFENSMNYNTAIEDAYKIIEKELKSIFNIQNNCANESLLNFVEYLNNYVVILRVEVPKETDLNHYFEIMNNRGEQLEKHEVLKSHLLSYLENIQDEEERNISKELFNTIWDGCSQMERYIQYAFEKDQRNIVFGNHWDEFIVNDFDELINKNKKYESKKTANANATINSIINNPKYENALINNTTETPERFNSVINFQNFILQCLLVFKEDNAFKLDDKKLISNFDFLKNQNISEQIKFVKEFIFCILKMKFLLDNYVIKREFINSTESWSLKKLHLYNDKSQSYIGTFGTDENEGDNRILIWLMSMFHTVAPNMMYKQWLNATLKYLYSNFSEKGIDSKHFITHLEKFVKQLIYKRFLVDDQIDYFDIIYSKSDNSNFDASAINWDKLKYSKIENNLVFNYIDYLLIKEIMSGEFSSIKGIKSFASKFEFTFRSSVEHYYPQNPKDGFDKLDEETLHSIGNLTLISHSKNSAMNNYMPKAKKEHYKDGSIADSTKQFIMFNKYPDSYWGENEIKEHAFEIINLLKKQLN